MKILLVLGKYLPGKTAGIENYSHLLATALLRNNHLVDAAILHSADMEPYQFEGVNVIPLQNGFESFNALLRNGGYEVCHFQEYSGVNGIYIKWFTTARIYCKRIFFTFHLPYLTCYKSDFRYRGIEDCNNFTSPERCVECIIATKLKYKPTTGFSLFNFAIKSLIPVLKRTNQIAKIGANIRSREDDLNRLINTCDNIFIYANWFKEILNKNGYRSPVIKKIPYITKTEFKMNREDNPGIKKKILFVGRIEPAKGLHLLCAAMNLVSTAGIKLDVFGNIVDEEYYKRCFREYAFNFKNTIPRPELLQLLVNYDFYILPSVFTEMYSMMIKDAFYEQLPVIASAAKGNKDVIREGESGFIFEYDNFKDLARAIDHAYALKNRGWKPVFETSTTQDEDGEEILSYYTL